MRGRPFLVLPNPIVRGPREAGAGRQGVSALRALRSPTKVIARPGAARSSSTTVGTVILVQDALGSSVLDARIGAISAPPQSGVSSAILAGKPTKGTLMTSTSGRMTELSLTQLGVGGALRHPRTASKTLTPRILSSARMERKRLIPALRSLGRLRTRRIRVRVTRKRSALTVNFALRAGKKPHHVGVSARASWMGIARTRAIAQSQTTVTAFASSMTLTELRRKLPRRLPPSATGTHAQGG